MTQSCLVLRRTALTIGAGVAGLPLFAGLLGAISPVYSQQSPPESEEAKRIVALVDKAAALIGSKGKSVFPEFRKTGSEWRNGDTYLFVIDMKGRNLFNGGFPQLEGADISGLKDSKGKLIVAEQRRIVQSKGSGWIDYMFPKPGQDQPSQKWSYVKAVAIDGTPAFVGAGFYTEEAKSNY